jgi:hypothetical protein
MVKHKVFFEGFVSLLLLRFLKLLTYQSFHLEHILVESSQIYPCRFMLLLDIFLLNLLKYILVLLLDIFLLNLFKYILVDSSFY